MRCLTCIAAISDALKTLQAFTDHYFNTFDNARPNLTPLYSEQAVLTFNDSTPIVGQQAISQKLAALPFQQVSMCAG